MTTHTSRRRKTTEDEYDKPKDQPRTSTTEQEPRTMPKYTLRDEPHAALSSQEEGSWQGIINRPLKLSARRAVWKCDHRHRAEAEALICAQREWDFGR